MKKALFFLFCQFFATCYSFGQVIDSLPSDEVQVFKRFKSNIKHSSKVDFSPEPLLIDTSRRAYDYGISFISPDLEVEKARLEYRPLRPQSLYAANHLYAKFGFGTPKQAVVDLSYGQLDPSVVAWNIDFKHQSLDVEDSYNDFAHTEGGIMGLFLLNQNWSVEGNLRASQITNQYYPLSEDSTYEESDATRKWSSILPSIDVQGHVGGFSVNGSLDYRYDKENVASESSLFSQSLSVEKSWNDGHFFSIKLDHQLGVQQMDTFENTITLLQAYPSYSFVEENWAVNAGLKLVNTDDFSFIPTFSIAYAFDSNKSLKLEYSGYDRPWSLPSILALNPFITTLQSLNLVQKNRDARATWRQNLGALQYHLGAGYVWHTNRPFFLNNSLEMHTFDLVPGEGGSIDLRFGLDLMIHEQSSFGVLVEKSYYELKNQVKPWHLPTYQIHIFGQHSLFSEKLMLKLDLIMQGDAAYKDDLTSDTLEPFVFLRLNSKYRINDHWSAFLDVNNILNQTNPLFLGYETIGLNFTTGIILKY